MVTGNEFNNDISCRYIYNNFSSFSAKPKFSNKRESLSMLTNEVVSFLVHRTLLRLDHF